MNNSPQLFILVISVNEEARKMQSDYMVMLNPGSYTYKLPNVAHNGFQHFFFDESVLMLVFS